MRTRKALAAALVAAASAVLLIPVGQTASATTGDTYVLPPSVYVIPPELITQFYGSYHLTSVGRGSKLTAADIFITSNSYGDLYGGSDFYGYDATGSQTSWTNLLYDFHLVTPAGATVTPDPWTPPAQVAADRIVVSLYGWGSPSLGTLTLTRKPDGDLAGTIRLYGQSSVYPIAFHRIGPVSP